MSSGMETINTLAANGLPTLLRASGQGGLAFVCVWVLCRLLPRLSAPTRSWLWRLAFLKLLLALLWLPTLDLPLLPPEQQARLASVFPPAHTLAESSVPEAALPATYAPLPEALPTMPLSASGEAAPAALSSEAVAAPSVALTGAAWLGLLWAGSLVWQSVRAFRQ